MSQHDPRYDPFLSQQSQPVTPFSQHGQSQYGVPTPLPRPLSQQFTQLDTRVFEREEERQRQLALAAQAAYDAQQAEYDAQQAAQQAEYNEAASSPSWIPDFSQPLPHPPGNPPLTDKELNIANRVLQVALPVQRQGQEYIVHGNQEAAAAAEAKLREDDAVVRNFMSRSREAQQRVEAAAASRKKKGGSRRKKSVKSKRNLKRYTRKSNKNKMQRKKSHGRSRYY